MSPSSRGSATDRIEVEPDVLIRAGQRLTTVGTQLGMIADLTKPMLSNGIASGFDLPGLNFALEYSDDAGVLAETLAAGANSVKAVGLMIQASGHTYRNADAASTLPGGAAMGGVGEPPTETVAVSIPAMPNGFVVPPPGAWLVIYPVVQLLGGLGMTWPMGNPTFMRLLAAQWDTVGAGAKAFNDDIDAIKTVVSMQDIPEGARMLADLQEMDDQLAFLATHAADLATRIRDFAQGVEDTQNAIRRILDRVSSLDSILDTITGLFSGEAEEIARDLVAVLNNFQRQVKAIVGLLNQGKQALNDALTAFQELNRNFLVATFGDDVGNALATGFDYYSDFEMGILNGVIGTVSGTVEMLDADTWKGMYDVAMQVADDPSKLDDVLLNMGKQFIAYDAWSGDHPGRAAGEAAFNVASLFAPGGAASKTGTLAKGFRYGSTLAREGRLPRLSDLPGVGRHTPRIDTPPGAGRGLPEGTTFTPGRVPDSLTSGTPGHVDPPSTPRDFTGTTGPHDPPGPTTAPGHRGGGGDDPPPGGGGRPVEPPTATPGQPSHTPSTPGAADSPRVSEPHAPSSPGSDSPRISEPSAPSSSSHTPSTSDATPHTPETSSPPATHDGNPSRSENGAAHHTPDSSDRGERTDSGRSPAGHPPADPPATAHTGAHEQAATDGRTRDQPQSPSDAIPQQHQNPSSGTGFMGTPVGGHMGGAHTPSAPHTPDASPHRTPGSREAGNRTPETRSPQAGTRESNRSQTPAAAGPEKGQSPAAPVKPAAPPPVSDRAGEPLRPSEPRDTASTAPRDTPDAADTPAHDRPGTQPDPHHSAGPDPDPGNPPPHNPEPNHPGPPGNPAEDRIYGPHELDDLEDPAYQDAVDNALRDAVGNPLVYADPRTNDYGQLINDGGPTVDGRSNNCLDCSLSALSSFFGDPTVSVPRYLDRLADGTIDRRSGELGGLSRAADWLNAGMLEFANRSLTEQFDAIHHYVDNLGPGSAALVHNGWHAFDEDANAYLYHADGTPVTGGSHATVIVHPDGANGPVWWDPQEGLTADHPPSWLTDQSTFVHFTPIDPSQGAHHGGTGNHGSGSGLPSGDVSDGDVPASSVPPRVGGDDGPQRGADRSWGGAGIGSVGDRLDDGDRVPVPELVVADGDRGVHGVQGDGEPGGSSDLPPRVGDHDPADGGGRADDRVSADGTVTDGSTGSDPGLSPDDRQTHLEERSEGLAVDGRDVVRGVDEPTEQRNLAGDGHDAGIAEEGRSHAGSGNQGTGAGASSGDVADRDVPASTVPPRLGGVEGPERAGDAVGSGAGAGPTGDRGVHGIQGDGREPGGSPDLPPRVDDYDPADGGGRPDDRVSADGTVADRPTGSHPGVSADHQQTDLRNGSNEPADGRGDVPRGGGEPTEQRDLAGNRHDSGVVGEHSTSGHWHGTDEDHAGTATDGIPDDAVPDESGDAPTTFDRPEFHLANPLEHMSAELRAMSEQHLTANGETVLGPFAPRDGSPSYIDVARARGASYFDLGAAWENFSGIEQLAANQHVLDVAIANRDVITLNTTFDMIGPNTYIAAELRYLEAHGYTRMGDHTLIPPTRNIR
jgi:hypothetical protein